MIVPDVNMLLYAQVSGFAEHAKARRWWEGLLNGDREVAIEAWVSRPHVRFALPGPLHLEIAFDLLRELGAAGSLTTDVQLAALAIEHQGEVHSNDADFGRFRRLRWVNPLR